MGIKYTMKFDFSIEKLDSELHSRGERFLMDYNYKPNDVSADNYWQVK